MSITLDTYLSQFLPALPMNEIYELCQTEPRIRSICRDESYWQNLISTYYPEAGIKPNTMSWFEFYIQTYKYANALLNVFPNSPPNPKLTTYYNYYQLLSEPINTRRY